MNSEKVVYVAVKQPVETEQCVKCDVDGYYP